MKECFERMNERMVKAFWMFKPLKWNTGSTETSKKVT